MLLIVLLLLVTGSFGRESFRSLCRIKTFPTPKHLVAIAEKIEVKSRDFDLINVWCKIVMNVTLNTQKNWNKRQ